MSTRDHILYVNPTAVHGGAEEALLHTMIAAHELGYQPVLVTPKTGWLAEQSEQRGILTDLAPTLPDTFATTDWRQQIRPWIPSALSIARLVRKWHAVIVHSNTPRTSYHGGLGARLASALAVTHVHDMSGLPYATSRQAALLTRLADWTLVPSHAVERAVVAYVPSLQPRIQTLYYGWNQAQYDGVEPADLHVLFGIPSDAVVVGNAAAFHPWKGQDVLIEAFRAVHAQHPNAHLLIVGGSQGGRAQSDFAVRLREQVRDLALDGCVTFTGWREDVWSLIKSVDIFVHVPIDPDPLPTSLIHACALRRPIVAAATGGIPEIVEDGVGGLLVPSRDANAVAGALLNLLGDPQRRAAFGEQAHEHFVRRFSHEQMVTGLADAYRQCLATKAK